MKTKLLAIGLFTLATSAACLAEHDAIYCGTITADDTARYYDEKPDAVLKVQFTFFVGDPWEDRTATTDAYAALYIGDETQRKFIETEKKKRNRSEICVEGRWGGALYESTEITRIDLGTDSISRVDYAEAFESENL